MPGSWTRSVTASPSSRSATGCSAAPSPGRSPTHVVIDVAGTIAAGGEAHRTPDGVDDRTAATLTIAGCTAAAALAVVKPGPGDTVLIGGAGGGVGVFAVQLARLAGARVIGTGSADIGRCPARPRGRAGRLWRWPGSTGVRALAPDGVTAAMDLYGTETAQAARELGVPDERITTIAAQVDGITAANGANAARGAIDEIARLVAAGRLRVPIAARFPVEQIRAAVELQAGSARARQGRHRPSAPIRLGHDDLDLAEVQGLVDDVLTHDDDTDLPATNALFQQLIDAATPSGQCFTCHPSCLRFVMCLD